MLSEASKSGYPPAIMVASSLEFDGRKHDLKIHALLAVIVMMSLVKHSWNPYLIPRNPSGPTRAAP